MTVLLRKAQPMECHEIYQLMHDDMTWKNTDAPYFSYEQPTLSQFSQGLFQRLCLGDSAQVITVDKVIIGSVGCHWVCQDTRWLEVGITIYTPAYWGKGIGKSALQQWISHMFATQTIARVGLSTWSGNPAMMTCASALGMKQEACLRKARYFNGVYYDAIKYGVLRQEWHNKKTTA